MTRAFRVISWSRSSRVRWPDQRDRACWACGFQQSVGCVGLHGSDAERACPYLILCLFLDLICPPVTLRGTYTRT